MKSTTVRMFCKFVPCLWFVLPAFSLVGVFEQTSFAQTVPGDDYNYQAGVRAAGGRYGVGGTSTQACSRNLSFIEGSFGALIAVAAGIGAIIASALGAYKAGWNLLVVSVGCFILRAFLTLFHGPCRSI